MFLDSRRERERFYKFLIFKIVRNYTTLRKLLIWIELQTDLAGTNLRAHFKRFRSFEDVREEKERRRIAWISKVAPSKTNYATSPCWERFPPEIGRWSNGNDFLPRHLVPTGAWVCTKGILFLRSLLLFLIRLGSQHCSTVRLPAKVKFGDDTGNENGSVNLYINLP